MKWSEIDNSGISNGLNAHSLIRVSLSQLFLLGGNSGITDSSISNRVATFDVGKSQWKKEARLSSKFGGNKGGLQRHQAFEYPNGSGVSVICIGGYVDKDYRQHPDHFVIFDFPLDTGLK